MLRQLLRSLVDWFKQIFGKISAAYSYTTVRENLQESINRRISLRSRNILKNEFAASRQEADCLASAETAGMLINEMMTFYLKQTHSDLREYVGRYRNQDWYWYLILKQIIFLTCRSLSCLAESRVIACIKFRVSLPFELLKDNPDYLGKTVSDILCSHENIELTFKCILDASSGSDQLKKDSVEWFVKSLKHSLQFYQKESFEVDPGIIKRILSSAVDIDCKGASARPTSGWQTLPRNSQLPGGDINLDN